VTDIRRRFTILDAINDKNLFAGWFRDRSTWAAWFVFLRALFGLPLADHELGLYRECTGRESPPTKPASEGWLICGRRSGKSFILALTAVYLGAFHQYRRHLAPGERGTIMVIACDRRQARTIFRYIGGLLTKVPMLARMVERQTAECFDLNNDVSIEVAVASFRSVRGYTVVAALLDELAFWRSDESSNPDTEIIAALKPAMATIPNAMLLCASSPYAQRGALFTAFKAHYGKPGDMLVWKAPTRTMNATVPQSVIDAAMEADPASASAEYLAQFRTDVEAYVARDVIEAVTIANRFELPRIEHVRYFAFVDPSGGSSDSMTLAVCHVHGKTVIVDLIRERRSPFSPDDVVKEFAAALKTYGISKVTGDRYAGEWPRERFRAHEIEYRVADKTKSDLYLALLPLLNSGRIELLDNQRLTAQLCSLERRTSRAGKDSIDHVPGGHDDVANACAGAAVFAAHASAHPAPKFVSPGIWSKSGGGWVSDPCPCPPATTAPTRTVTEEFYASGYFHAVTDPFAREW
jgi:hypothetical protein